MLKKLAIQAVQALGEVHTRDRYLELKLFEEERIEQERLVRQHLEKRRKKK